MKKKEEGKDLGEGKDLENSTEAEVELTASSSKIVKKGDFVEIDYIATVKESGTVFDATNEIVAKENELFSSEAAYGPVTICIGKRHVLAGVDRQLEGKDIGKSYTFDVLAAEGFGKKNPRLIQLISTSKFRKERIAPYPGLQVNIDGVIGIVKTVSGGRTLVDFNHPLSGKELSYTVTIHRIITDTEKKLSAFLNLALGAKGYSLKMADGNAEIDLQQELPAELQKRMEDEIKACIPELKSLKFSKKEEPEQESIPAEKAPEINNKD